MTIPVRSVLESRTKSYKAERYLNSDQHRKGALDTSTVWRNQRGEYHGLSADASGSGYSFVSCCVRSCPAGHVHSSQAIRASPASANRPAAI